METEVWIAIAVAGITIVAIVALLLFIHWTVGRSVRGEVGATMQPVLDLTNHVTRLVDQARDTQLDLQARLDEASEIRRSFDEAIEQLRTDAGQRSSQFSEFAAARETEIQEAVDQTHAQIVQTLDVMNWTETEAAKLVDELQCLQEEVVLEQQIRAALSQIAADQSRAAGQSRLRFGRITTDSPFLDFVVKAEDETPRYLSVQIKALGDRYAAEALQREVERAAAIQSAMPENGLLTPIVVVNRLPNGSDNVADLLARLDDTGVEVVPVDEFCEYARAWVSTPDAT